MKTAEKRSLELKTPEKEKPSLKIDPTAVRDKDWDTNTTRSEICLSPSWSDHGEKERKRAKKLKDKEKKRQEEERREAGKKAKKEEERQKAAAAKASKRDARLSKKPPPAAMDTQRMPTELRRLSVISNKSGETSRENSQPPSREWRRLSGISIGSTKSKSRSQSTPPTSTEVEGTMSGEWQAVVSAAAPQLPALHGIGLESRNASSHGSKSNSWGSDASYSREWARFARRLSRGSPALSPQQASFYENPNYMDPSLAPAPARPLLRSQTDNDISKVSQDSPVVKEVEQALADRRNSKDPPLEAIRVSKLQNGHAKNGAHDLSVQKSFQDSEAVTGVITSGAHANYRREHKQPLNPLQMNPPSKQSIDGSSYVHRQRMYQQQRSLAGFQDEEAVRDANRNMEVIEPPFDEPQPDQSGSTVEQDIKPPAPNNGLPAKQDVGSGQGQLDQYHVYLKACGDLQAANKFQQQPHSKMDRILGFGRRPKPSQQPSVKTNKSVGSDGSETMVPSQLPSLEIPRQEARAPQVLKTECILGEPPPSSASPQTPKARSKLSQAIVDKEISPKAKDRPAVPRARTAQATPTMKTSPPREKETAGTQSQAMISQAVEARSPDIEAPLVRTHSRTRTSSSQLLNDNISMSRPIARSTTAPVLPAIKLQPFHSTPEDLGTNKQVDNAVSLISPRSLHTSVTAHDGSRRVKGPRSPPEPKPRSPTESKSRSPKKSTPPQSPDVPKPTTKAAPEVVVESVNSEGIVRKTSMKRPRSNPQLQTVTPTPPLPSFDFLPELKHQPLTKPKPRASLVAPAKTSETARRSSHQFPAPAGVQAEAVIPTSNSAPNILAHGRSWGHQRPASHHAGEKALTRADPRRELGNRMSTLGPLSHAGAEKELDRPLAKMFVVCCSCRFWHDLPSKVYEAMAVPKTLQREKGQLTNNAETGIEKGKLDTMVECPWCQHHMSTECCAGWTAVCYLHERHH